MSMLPMILVLLAQAAAGAGRPDRDGGRPRRQAGRRGGGRAGRRRIAAVPYNWLDHGVVPRPPAVLETRRADADGRFRVELPETG